VPKNRAYNWLNIISEAAPIIEIFLEFVIPRSLGWSLPQLTVFQTQIVKCKNNLYTFSVQMFKHNWIQRSSMQNTLPIPFYPSLMTVVEEIDDKKMILVLHLLNMIYKVPQLSALLQSGRI